MNKNLALVVAGIIFSIVALIHLLRLVYQFQIVVGDTVLSMQTSVFGLIIGLLLAFWMFAASRS